MRCVCVCAILDAYLVVTQGVENRQGQLALNMSLTHTYRFIDINGDMPTYPAKHLGALTRCDGRLGQHGALEQVHTGMQRWACVGPVRVARDQRAARLVDATRLERVTLHRP